MEPLALTFLDRAGLQFDVNRYSSHEFTAASRAKWIEPPGSDSRADMAHLAMRSR